MALVTPKHVETLKTVFSFGVECAFFGVMNKWFSHVAQNKQMLSKDLESLLLRTFCQCCIGN